MCKPAVRSDRLLCDVDAGRAPLLRAALRGSALLFSVPLFPLYPLWSLFRSAHLHAGLPLPPRTALPCLLNTSTRAWRRFWACTSASTFRCSCAVAWPSARACWAWRGAHSRCGGPRATVCAVWRWNCGSPCCGSVMRVLSPLALSLALPPRCALSLARLSDSAVQCGVSAVLSFLLIDNLMARWCVCRATGDGRASG